MAGEPRSAHTSGDRSQRAVSAGNNAGGSSRGRSAAVAEGLTGARQSALYREIQRVARQALRAMRPRREPAADLVGDVAARAMLGLRRWRAECGLGTWVYGIARNELVRREEAERRTVARIGALAGEPEPASVPTPEDLLAVGERCCELARALARLSFKRRISLLGLDVWEIGAEAVAGLLGVKPGAVREASRKARVQLGRLLAQVGEGRSGAAARETCGIRGSTAVGAWRRWVGG